MGSGKWEKLGPGRGGNRKTTEKNRLESLTKQINQTTRSNRRRGPETSSSTIPEPEKNREGVENVYRI